MNDHLMTEFGLWTYKNALRVEVFSMALAALEGSKSLDEAKETLKIFRDSYLVSSWPGGLRDESTDHQL
jgi:hypothetical protein